MRYTATNKILLTFSDTTDPQIQNEIDQINSYLLLNAVISSRTNYGDIQKEQNNDRWSQIIKYKITG